MPKNKTLRLAFAARLSLDRANISVDWRKDFQMAMKSKWFRVAVEGATTDGRELSKADILDMAETYNRETYGARVNLEHFRGLTAGSPFDMLGDVLALRSQEDELIIGAKTEKRTCLYAEVAPLPNLIALSKAGQKIFTSVEVQPDFAKTGKAGLVGLAVTDSPASLGTEVLTFAAKNPNASPFSARKQSEGNLFTEAHETLLEFFEDADGSSEQAGAFAAISKFFTAIMPPKADAKTEHNTPPKQAENGGEGNLALSSIAQGMLALTTMVEASVKSLTDANKVTADGLASLKNKLEQEPDLKRLNRRGRDDGTEGDGKHFTY
jgi:Phage capsid scaffolding protein (GPO) serine peptidase